MDSANYENYAWIYVHEDDWDQDGVLLETWLLAIYASTATTTIWFQDLRLHGYYHNKNQKESILYFS